MPEIPVVDRSSGTEKSVGYVALPEPTDELAIVITDDEFTGRLERGAKLVVTVEPPDGGPGQ